jgi:hypothetical protein
MPAPLRRTRDAHEQLGWCQTCECVAFWVLSRGAGPWRKSCWRLGPSHCTVFSRVSLTCLKLASSAVTVQEGASMGRAARRMGVGVPHPFLGTPWVWTASYNQGWDLNSQTPLPYPNPNPGHFAFCLNPTLTTLTLP